MSQKDHICVCICTYQRPELLGRLLSKLGRQVTEVLFDYSLVIVDNDKSESARLTVESFARKSRISIRYYVEPEQNIALARNKALQNAKGDFVGFIDDDEFPLDQWLLNHYKAMNSYKADGILGPVLPHFEEEPPRWVLKGRFFDRPSHPTGHVLEWKNTRSGNALMRRELFQEGRNWFNPAFGSGGEDRDFFKRKMERGHVFVWCNEAPVFELVPPIRWKRTVLLKRALLRGKMAMNASGAQPVDFLKSAIAIVFYTASLPLFIMAGHHVFMKYLVKNFDHIGKLLAMFRVEIIKETYIMN